MDYVVFQVVIFNSIAGKTPPKVLIKESTDKGQAVTSNGEEPSTKRVRFDRAGVEMERENEDPEAIPAEDPESATMARAPSFFIGKPLVDFDAGIGRVSWNTALM